MCAHRLHLARNVRLQDSAHMKLPRTDNFHNVLSDVTGICGRFSQGSPGLVVIFHYNGSYDIKS